MTKVSLLDLQHGVHLQLKGHPKKTVLLLAHDQLRALVTSMQNRGSAESQEQSDAIFPGRESLT